VVNGFDQAILIQLVHFRVGHGKCGEYFEKLTSQFEIVYVNAI
jgi:hypothetical protein